MTRSIIFVGLFLFPMSTAHAGMTAEIKESRQVVGGKGFDLIIVGDDTINASHIAFATLCNKLVMAVRVMFVGDTKINAKKVAVSWSADGQGAVKESWNFNNENQAAFTYNFASSIADELEVSDRLTIRVKNMEGILHLGEVRDTVDDFFERCGKLEKQ